MTWRPITLVISCWMIMSCSCHHLCTCLDLFAWWWSDHILSVNKTCKAHQWPLVVPLVRGHHAHVLNYNMLILSVIISLTLLLKLTPQNKVNDTITHVTLNTIRRCVIYWGQFSTNESTVNLLQGRRFFIGGWQVLGKRGRGRWVWQCRNPLSLDCRPL